MEVQPVTGELNETRRKQQALLEHRMYHLDPAPPKLPPQEYIELYFAEKEDKYLSWYLHDREPILNKLAQDTCQRYSMPEHFADIKQVAVCGILAALQKYDPSIGVPFAAFQKQYISDGIADYIRTARAKGLRERTVVYKHALKNALIPVVTLAGMQFSQVFAGAVLVETVFNWPGMGRLAYESILRKDYPTLVGILFCSVFVVIIANVLTDFAYRFLDPKMRVGRR